MADTYKQIEHNMRMHAGAKWLESNGRTVPSWYANEQGWWRCDDCAQPINPRMKAGQPTPEVPHSVGDGSLRWTHRECPTTEDRQNE